MGNDCYEVYVGQGGISIQGLSMHHDNHEMLRCVLLQHVCSIVTPFLMPKHHDLASAAHLYKLKGLPCDQAVVGSVMSFVIFPIAIVWPWSLNVNL